MGYTTDFEGFLKSSRELTETEMTYINTFSETRRMKRDPLKLMELYQGQHGLPNADITNANRVYGIDGEFYAFDDSCHGQNKDASIIEYNEPPKTQPGLWCQWYINDNGDLEWDGGEKFYSYVEWLKYLINNFFNPWDVKFTGEITWQGEDDGDLGIIIVKENIISVKRGKKTITYVDDPNY